MGRIKFGVLQDSPACGLDSMVASCGGRRYRESSAVLRVARHLGAPWSFLWIFILIPRPLRDALYRYVARRRHTIWTRPAEGESSV